MFFENNTKLQNGYITILFIVYVLKNLDYRVTDHRCHMDYGYHNDSASDFGFKTGLLNFKILKTKFMTI